ncbi:MAG: (deoxy)nucleoside triphosphate pyrophosphohydrolase [Acidobacteria bacterium]|nr:(deoxy)nucleoside triphosphate pyrophosphohydrolase [Acidobacteriota bacterium]
MTTPTKRILVAAAVIRRGDEYFVTRRQTGVHLEGYWEFPGGKCDEGETLDACLCREIREELDAAVRVGAEILAVAHEYEDRVLELRFFECELLGEPRAVLGQEMQWVPRGLLRALEFPPADAALLDVLAGQA